MFAKNIYISEVLGQLKWFWDKYWHFVVLLFLGHHPLSRLLILSRIKDKDEKNRIITLGAKTRVPGDSGGQRLLFLNSVLIVKPYIHRLGRCIHLSNSKAAGLSTKRIGKVLLTEKAFTKKEERVLKHELISHKSLAEASFSSTSQWRRERNLYELLSEPRMRNTC